jgi:pre-mRNA-processing factor SLU7
MSVHARDQFKQQKALDEARKAGTAEPEKDEEGRDINPHIPQYIAKAPWYLSKGVPSLQHQRREDREGTAEQWYAKGAKLGEAATKYRKGACENCGAITHKTKDCVERRRRKGAKITGKNIEADEVIMDISLNYDGKRDRWNGYDPSTNKDFIDRFQKLDEERRKFKTKQLNSKSNDQKDGQDQKEEEKMIEDEDDEIDIIGEADEDEREAEGQAAVFSGVNPKNKTSVKNLRIREDTAKYLYNLSDESAHYDPKTRSMRENPLPEYSKNELVFAGDNALRRTGQWKNFVDIQRYAWEASEHGQEVHMVAIPSQAELSFRNFQEKKQALKESHRKSILEAYGGEEYLKPPEEVQQLAETETYVQYSRDGKVLGGRAKAIKRSKYEEDVFVNGHTTVWGSLFKDEKWGYACCGQTGDRSVRCRVHDPLLAHAIVLPPPAPTVSAEAVTALEPVSNSPATKENQDDQTKSVFNNTEDSSSSEYSSSSDEEESKKKKKKTHKRKASQKDRENEDKEDPRIKAKRQRYSDSVPDSEITEEEYEKYKKNKPRTDDPMRNYVE